MKKISTERTFNKLIKDAKQITIFTHHNPDGDAVGSSLALYLALKKIKKKIKIIVPNSFPEFLNWMHGSEHIVNFDKNKESAKQWISQSDLVFLLDCNAFTRLGFDELPTLVEQSKATKILIDHHRLPAKYFNAYFFNDAACSTCELVYLFLQHINLLKVLNKKIAECIYTGIMTDTGSFKFDSVTAQTHQITAHLLRLKINHTQIHQAVFDTYSYDRLKLIGYSLSEKMVYIKDYATAYIALSAKELRQFNHKKGDTEGLVNTPLSINNVILSALFTETSDGIKISLRSKGNLDVNIIARTYFNGGGHKNAAGGQLNSSLIQATNLFEKVVKELNIGKH